MNRNQAYADRHPDRVKESWRKYYAKNAEKLRAIDKKRYAKNKKEKTAKHKQWYQENKDFVKNRDLLKKYGITLEQQSEMLKSQNNKCKICGKEEKLVVDHCHKTGKVRGLLCHKCNRGIGHLQDNIEILKKAIDYLQM